jgi:hypothetical protein
MNLLKVRETLLLYIRDLLGSTQVVQKVGLEILLKCHRADKTQFEGLLHRRINLLLAAEQFDYLLLALVARL